MEKIAAYLGLFMSLLFIFLGVYLPLYPPPILAANALWFNIVIGLVLIVYGAFRFYRAYKTLKKT